MVAQFRHGVRRDVDSGGLRPVVDHDGDRALIGHRPEIERLRRAVVDEVLVVVRRPDHGCLVTHFRRAPREFQGLLHALDAGAAQEEFLRRGVLRHQFEHAELLLEREVHAFARRAADGVAGESRAVPLPDVVGHLGLVDLAVGVERRRDGREDSVELHHFLA